MVKKAAPRGRAKKSTKTTPNASQAKVTKPLTPKPKTTKAMPKKRHKRTTTTTTEKADKAAKTTTTAAAKTAKEKTGSTTAAKKKTRVPRIFSRKKQKTSDSHYVSVKNKTHTLLAKASGASTRGSVENDRNRFRLIWGIALVFLTILVARAFYLQVAHAHFYQQKGEELITSKRTQPAYRGMIVDRNDLPLAISAPLSTVTFSPYDYALKYYNTKKELINSESGSRLQIRMQAQLEEMDLTRLSNASGVPLETLQKATKINENIDATDSDSVKAALPSGAGSHYLLLLNKVTPEVADTVTVLGFAGVYEKQKLRRYYPQPQPSAQVLGFMGQNSRNPEEGYTGRSGIERQYETELAGKDGKILVLNDARRNSLKELKQIAPVIPGANIALTIDSRLQYLLYKELEKVGRIQQARWSTGIVVDITTGEVLALSTWPSFNTNNLSEMTGDNQRNRALIDVFEPGSVMKPFTVAAALDSGKYNVNTLINTSPGFIRVKGYTINDHGNLGNITMATLLKKSSNVASTKIALSLPADGISSIQKRFGFGEKTALTFPGEASGLIPTPKDKQTARRATMSYGYGLQVTLAQLAQAYAALGSGGVLHPLTLVKGEERPDARRVLDAKQAKAIVGMLEKVTEKGGTGMAATIDGYRVAGKTGTSRRVDPEGGYYKDQYRTIFAGIAPASNPRLATVILVEDPRENKYAGQVAAPVFKNVMQEALRLYNVPLDKPLLAGQVEPFSE